MICGICNTDACVHLDIQGDTEEKIAGVDPKVDGRPARVAKIIADIRNQTSNFATLEEKARAAIRMETTLGCIIATELVGPEKTSQFLIERITANCFDNNLPRPSSKNLEVIVGEIRRLSKQVWLHEPGVP